MLLWTNHITEQHYPVFDALKKTGYEGVEIPISGDGDVSHFTAIGDHLTDLGFGITVVSFLLEDSNIASPDPFIRQAGLDRLKWIIDMAHAARAELICGPIHSGFTYFSRQPPSESEKKWSIEMLQKAGEYAKQANIILIPEALNRFECYLVNTMADLSELLDGVNHPNVKGMIDTHHANMEEKSQREAIRHIRPHLRHVHISENDRGTPGKGQVHWDEVFDTLMEVGYDGWLMVEGFSMTKPDFANAINVWRNFSPIEEIYQEGFDLIKRRWRN